MISFVQSVWTVIALAVFIGIVLWAFSGKRKDDFDKAARMALDDDKPVSSSEEKIRSNHG